MGSVCFRLQITNRANVVIHSIAKQGSPLTTTDLLCGAGISVSLGIKWIITFFSIHKSIYYLLLGLVRLLTALLASLPAGK